MFAGYNPSTVKKWTKEDQLPLREAITGSNKGVEVHSTEAIFGTSPFGSPLVLTCTQE